jgi:predicted RNA binding protein YcfA (HicA-like mRNA interferase family)
MSKLSKLVEHFLTIPPEVRFNEVQYLLEKFGFIEKRSKGSHHIFENSEGCAITIPKKGGQKVKKIYVKRLIELLDLQNWKEVEDEQQGDREPEEPN